MSAHDILELSGTEANGGGWPFHRLHLLDSAPLAGSGGVPIIVHSLSTSGVLLETSVPLHLGQAISVMLPKGRLASATIVWNSGRLFVCRFAKRISRARMRTVPMRNPLPVGLEPEPLSPIVEAKQFVPGRMQNLREKQGMSRSTLAVRTGVSSPTIWAWEIGRKIPRPANLLAVARALNVAECHLMGGAVSPADVAGGIEQADDISPAGTASTVSNGAEELRGYIRDSKQRIAGLAGVECNKVKISIEY